MPIEFMMKVTINKVTSDFWEWLNATYPNGIYIETAILKYYETDRPTAAKQIDGQWYYISVKAA